MILLLLPNLSVAGGSEPVKRALNGALRVIYALTTRLRHGQSREKYFACPL